VWKKSVELSEEVRMKVYKALVRLVLTMFLMSLLAWQWPGSVAAAEATWRGEYFSNAYLLGAPTLVRQDADINFDWGAGAPGPGLPSDNFSVRWTRQVSFPAGAYRFYTRTDDGVRLFVDGRLLIDRWQPMSATTYSGDIQLAAGDHAIRMEYYERSGVASARLWWEPIGVPPVPEDRWRGEYYPNRSLIGSPRLVRYDSDVRFNWGMGSPDPSIPADNFSVRWTRNLQFQAGRYDFFVKADDGVRLYLDERIIIDEWHDANAETYQASLKLTEGVHALRLEYYEHTGRALVQLWWVRRAEAPRVGNLITCVRPSNSWIKVYRQRPDGSWQDMNPRGWGSIDPSGFLKIDGLPVEGYYGERGQPYRVELWANYLLIRSVGNTSAGQPEFRIYPWTDNYTPWGCPAP